MCLPFHSNCLEVITRSFLLTAAHCTNITGELFAVAGADHDLRTLYAIIENNRFIKKMIRHPDFKTVNPSDTDCYNLNDIAIVELELPFEFGAATNIYPACLPDQHLQYFDGDLYVAGYGDRKESFKNIKPLDQNDDSSKLFVADWPPDDWLPTDQFDESTKFRGNLMMTNLVQYRGSKCKLNMICAQHPQHSTCFG